MANKKINELDNRASLSLSDLMAVGDPSTGYLYKTTISDLKTLTGAGVISFNARFGAVTPAEGDYNLTQLGDVILTSPTANQVLTYNGSNWVNAAPAAETDTLDSVTGRGNTTSNGIVVGSVTASGLSNLLGQIKTFATTGNVYIGTSPGSVTDSGYKLDVNGTVRFQSTLNVGHGETNIATIDARSSTKDTTLYVDNSRGTGTNYAGIFQASGTANNIAGYFNATYGTSNIALRADYGNVELNVSSGTTKIGSLAGTGSRMVVTDANGVLSTQAIPTGSVTSVFGRTGTVVAASGDYTTAQVTESGNLYYTDARARGAISLTTTGTSGAATYNSSTGVLNIPQYQAQLNGTGFLRFSGTTPSYITGTSSQFVKADGTLDGTSYATAASLSGYMDLSTNQTAAGNKTFTGFIQLNGRQYIFLGDVGNALFPYIRNTGGDGIGVYNNAGSALFTMNTSTGMSTNGRDFAAGATTLSGTLNGTSLSMSGGGAFNTTSAVSGYALDVRGATNKRFGIANSGSLSGASVLFYTDANAFADGYLDASNLFLNSQSTGAVLINTTTTDGTNKLIVNGGVKANNSFQAFGYTNLPSTGSVIGMGFTGGVGYIQSWSNNAQAPISIDGSSFQVRLNNYATTALSLAATTGAATFSSSVTATGFFESSDSRIKTLISDSYHVKGIESITPKLYTKNGRTELGYFAQDFVGVLDTAITKSSDGMLSLSYREVLVAKIYALEKEIEQLKKGK